MKYSRHFFYNLPAYAQLMDDRGILEHFLSGLQDNLDEIRSRQEFLRIIVYSVDYCPDEWLPWLGQWVGLSGERDRFLGMGLNPDWPTAHKREVIRRAWEFWNRKGTEWAIREGTALWLRWEESHDRDRLEFVHPFGKQIGDRPPLWQGWGDLWSAGATRLTTERRRLGGGDRQPNDVLEKFDYFVPRSPHGNRFNRRWPTRNLYRIDRPTYREGSRLGPHSVWERFTRLTENEWHRFFPDVVKLNYELWATEVRSLPIGEMEIGTLSVSIFPEKPKVVVRSHFRKTSVDGIQFGDKFPRRKSGFTRTSPVETGGWATRRFLRFGDRLGAFPYDRTSLKDAIVLNFFPKKKSSSIYGNPYGSCRMLELKTNPSQLPHNHFWLLSTSLRPGFPWPSRFLPGSVEIFRRAETAFYPTTSPAVLSRGLVPTTEFYSNTSWGMYAGRGKVQGESTVFVPTCDRPGLAKAFETSHCTPSRRSFEADVKNNPSRFEKGRWGNLWYRERFFVRGVWGEIPGNCWTERSRYPTCGIYKQFSRRQVRGYFYETIEENSPKERYPQIREMATVSNWEILLTLGGGHAIAYPSAFFGIDESGNRVSFFSPAISRGILEFSISVGQQEWCSGISLLYKKGKIRLHKGFDRPICLAPKTMGVFRATIEIDYMEIEYDSFGG
jgi:phage tail-like protein